MQIRLKGKNIYANDQNKYEQYIFYNHELDWCEEIFSVARDALVSLNWNRSRELKKEEILTVIYTKTVY